MRKSNFKTIEAFNIIPGFRCTQNCAHCGNSSGTLCKGGIDNEDISRIVSAINDMVPPKVVLTGGEPALYVDELNPIIYSINYNAKIILTTNGFFATSIDRVEKTLRHFSQIDILQLSFDAFHGFTLESKSPRFLQDYCISNNIEFVLSISISKPEDLIFADKAQKRFNCRTIYQKIDASGRAKVNKLEFVYPSFDSEVLNQRCPNSETISFIHGKGFSHCCSNLVFNQHSGRYSYKSLKKLKSSNSYNEITTLTFRERLNINNISFDNLDSKYSAPCSLCEFIEEMKCLEKFL